MNTLAAKESEDTQSVLCDHDDSFTARLEHQIIPIVHASASGKATSAKKLHLEENHEDHEPRKPNNCRIFSDISKQAESCR